MTADLLKLRFYVDESALGLGKTLEAARNDTVHCGHKLIPECPLGTLDRDWIPIVAAKGLVAVGRDKRIRTRENEVNLIREYGLRVFRIDSRRDLSTWEWLRILVRTWPDIERIVLDRTEGPWYYGLGLTGPPKERSLG